ncbi:NlpC/P60 family protein [Alkaliphilus pronyensis]|uniref:NlpC/P60 family protein n=1 Tax=Alkaliphilus pronyensis TaxID=1482732 RepID=A0A6I0FNI9_9FIRM|nr:NlpC/P60 family protein [Alkaliphilus pronyensis]KAB3537884.1 NlpC/P60 family protein [Alkaliphilus pronyensis]
MAVDPLTIAKVATTIGKLGSSENGRWIILIALLTPLILILLLLASPFIIFSSLFSSGSSGEDISVQAYMLELQTQFQEKIEIEQQDPDMNSIETIVMGSEDNTLIDNSVQVLSFFSVLQTTENGEQVAYFDGASKDELEKLFWKMNQIDVVVEEEREEKTVTDSNGNASIITITTHHKTITINSLTAEEMATRYKFDTDQNQLLKEVLQSSDYILGIDGQMFLSNDEIEQIKSCLPVDYYVDRELIVEKAKSIVGKVRYFWGGKSLATDWDNRWGTPREVTADGSRSTGTVRPFGLDCSGYITWVFANTGLHYATIDKTIGHGVTAQWNTSTSITKVQVKKGDLAFIAAPNTRKINHIGIVVEVSDNGKILVAHCNSSANNVSIDDADTKGFRYFRRPAILIEDEGADAE